MNTFSYPLYLLSQVGFRLTQKNMEQFTLALNCLPNLEKAALTLGLPKSKFIKLISLSKNVSADQFQKTLKQYDTHAISYIDPEYPQLLKALYDPPLVLYYRGNAAALRPVTIGIVGMRRASSYGKAALAFLCKPLAGADVTIVSGLAYGIDAEAHQQALLHNIQTVAVLGSSVDDSSIYPRHHIALAQRILQNGGLLLSEYPPPTPARNFQFVARNRIIAGISNATVVIECAQKSGALITADYALQLGKPIFAVPGSILAPTSAGPNELIKQGAQALTEARDLAEALQITLSSNNATPTNLSEQETLVLKCMQPTAITFDVLQAQCKLSTSSLMSILTTLELQKLISNNGAAGFAKL